MAIQTGGVFEFYRYTPSVPAAAVWVLLFFLTAALHTYQIARTRTWIILPLVIGSYCEVTAYIGRIISSKQSPDYTVGVFIVTQNPSLLGPQFMAASIYLCLSRIIVAIDGQHLSLIRPTHLTLIFVLSDVMGLVVQGVGEKVVIAGLTILVTSSALFAAVAGVFEFRMRNTPTSRSCNTPLKWRRDLHVLYFSSLLIFIRSVYRLVEYSQGNAGWLLRHEWTLYAFDTVLMFLLSLLFNVMHPSYAKALLQGGKYSEKAGLQIKEIKLQAPPG
ncbi:MAG: hypothetical protein M1827_004461 [Pycnora praestabilis]|nr:MAG: hypothetical protein M1827_004461 [Pycnora praestabilis]